MCHAHSIHSRNTSAVNSDWIKGKAFLLRSLRRNLVDNAAIAELNNQYRNKPMPTDVLSFPLGENGVYDVDENNGCKMLGDIVISMERAQEQATLYGHPLQREVAFLTVHSMLHLLGYDHENGGLEAMRMREKEEAVLTQLGLPRTVSYTE